MPVCYCVEWLSIPQHIHQSPTSHTYGFMTIRFLKRKLLIFGVYMKKEVSMVLRWYCILLLFVHANSLLKSITFRSSKLWSELKTCMLLAIWLWDFLQTFTILLFFRSKRVIIVPRWYFLLFFSYLFIIMRNDF